MTPMLGLKALKNAAMVAFRSRTWAEGNDLLQQPDRQSLPTRGNAHASMNSARGYASIEFRKNDFHRVMTLLKSEVCLDSIPKC